jgi:NADH-quinone oxidoreductase subunit H
MVLNVFLITLEFTINTLLTIVPVLGTVAFFTLAERKIMGAIQRRTGPNLIGFLGLLQPLADGLKLIIKELILPAKANFILFLYAPALTLSLSFISWAFIPFNYNNCYLDATYSILFILVISAFGVYGILFAGWASNSKYAFLGSLRSAAQMVSYEVSIGTILLPIILCSGSMNFIDIVYIQQELGVWFVFLLLPLFVIFFISCLAETNRAPFDLPEAEAELVAGYNVEYSSVTFAMFFLGEYSNIILMSALNVIFFFCGWDLPYCIKFFFVLPDIIISQIFTDFLTLNLFIMPLEIIFSIKIILFCILFIWVRASLPRFRYDQLMDIGWKYFLPLSFGYFIFVTGVLFFLDAKPLYFFQVPFINQFDIYAGSYSEKQQYCCPAYLLSGFGYIK